MRDDSFEKLLKYLEGNKENANIVCGFIDNLTPTGFEHYIADYYRKIHGYVTEVNGGLNDKGIDIKGARINKNGEKEYLIIQCKKWTWGFINQKDKYYIGENEIAKFYGKVADHKNLWIIHIIYATTKDITQGGKVFCKEKRIETITYKELIELNKNMDLKEWIWNILQSNIRDQEKEKLISQEYMEKWNWREQEKQEIIEEARRKTMTEKEVFVHSTPTNNTSKKENTNFLVEWLFTFFKPLKKIITIIFLSYIALTIIWALNNYTKNTITKNTKIGTISNNNQTTTPNKKKNIQKAIHTTVQ